MRVEHLDVTYLTMIYYSGIWIFQGRMDHQVHTYSDTIDIKCLENKQCDATDLDV